IPAVSEHYPHRDLSDSLVPVVCSPHDAQVDRASEPVCRFERQDEFKRYGLSEGLGRDLDRFDETEDGKVQRVSIESGAFTDREKVAIEHPQTASARGGASKTPASA